MGPSKDATMNPRPDWYPDPQNPTIVRYWDGQQWTNRTQARSANLATINPKPPMTSLTKVIWFLIALFVGVVALIMGTTIVANLAGSKPEPTYLGSDAGAEATTRETKTPTRTPATTTTKQEQVATGFGTEVRDGKFGFVVTKVESGLATIGKESSWFSETAEGQFVVVYVDVTNTSNKSQYYASSNQVLIDDQGREFTNNFSAEFGLEGDDKGAGDINPGITRSTRVVFDIPVGAVPVAIEVHDSMFSGGARINFN